MSKGYLVRKTIRGKPYLYRQRSWREAGKVRTECICLGPVTDTTTTKPADTIDPENITFGNPFVNRNTTNIATTFGNPFTDHPAQTGSKVSPSGYLAQFNAQALASYEEKLAAGEIKPQRRQSQTNSNTTNRMPRDVTFDGDFGDRKISTVALAREFE